MGPMVVRTMSLKSISQCAKSLDFQPRQSWPESLPAVSWRSELLCGFNRKNGQAVDVFELQGANLIDSLKACHPELGLAEMARLTGRLKKLWPDLYLELREALFSVYGLKWSTRLDDVFSVLRSSPVEFQNWVDEKKFGARDLFPLLAVKELRLFDPFLKAIPGILLSKFEGARVLEYGVELFLMDRPLNDLLPSMNNGGLWLRRLEQWRRPQTAVQDDEKRRQMTEWPWPAHVQAQWQRFGDEAGLEIKIRTTSPEDLEKKLERLMTIPETWSCKN